MAAILDLPISSIENFLDHALEKEINQTAFDVWISVYPLMIEEKIESIDFEDFKGRFFKKQTAGSNKSIKEIEKEMDEIITAYEKAVK